MDEIRIRYTVNQKAAVLAGQKFYGDVETTVDPATLSQEQRVELAQCDTDKGVIVLNRYQQDIGEISLGTCDDAHIVTLLDARIRVRHEKKAKEEKEHNENYARCAALLSGDTRADVLEKIVRGQKIGWVFPGSTQDAEKWWADHQAEFADEMAAIQNRIDQEAQVEKERIDGIRKSRADEALAAGVDGFLQRIDDHVWQTRRIAESDYGAYYEQVSALHDKAIAEAARRNEAEKTARQDQINAWVAEKGTENQKGRHALGLLPENEVLDAMRAEVYSPLDAFPRYEKIKRDDLDHAEYCDSGISCNVNPAKQLDAEEFDHMQQIQKSAPVGATIEALTHRCECKNDDCDAAYTKHSAQIKIAVGAFTFTREYAL